MSYILGVDPGLSGALAFYSPITLVTYDMPVVDGGVDAAELTRLIRSMDVSCAVVERVHSMPKQGVSSVWTFGYSAGVLRGVIVALGIPLHLVSPTVWKRHYRLGADKEASRALAIQLWPTSADFRRKKDHGRAEAALMAKYGAEVINK